MRQGRRGTFLALVLVLLIISYSTTCARILRNDQGSGSGSSMATMEEDDDMAALMGSEEECSGNDQGCVNRRMIADAHLDYIYTQHHKPKASP